MAYARQSPCLCSYVFMNRAWVASVSSMDPCTADVTALGTVTGNRMLLSDSWSTIALPHLRLYSLMT